MMNTKKKDAMLETEKKQEATEYSEPLFLGKIVRDTAVSTAEIVAEASKGILSALEKLKK